MPLDGTFRGEEPRGPYCASCKAPITKDQRSVRVDFKNDPQGHRGFTGLYHEQCSRPFVSIARVMNMDWFGRY